MKICIRRLSVGTVVLSSVVSVMSLGGCVVGNDTRVYRPTLGQQLIDLQKARDAGAMTEAEYATERSKLLSKGPSSDAGSVSVSVPNGSR